MAIPELATPFQDEIPPLSQVELSMLEADVLRHGILSPIVTTTKKEILDGHNRYALAQKHDLAVKTHVLRESKDWGDDQKRWKVQELALAQRNLTPDQKREINTRRDKMIRADRKAGMTQKAIGEKYGVSRERVKQVTETVVGATTTSAGKPGAVRDASTDARIKINPQAKPVIAERVEEGEPVAGGRLRGDGTGTRSTPTPRAR